MHLMDYHSVPHRTRLVLLLLVTVLSTSVIIPAALMAQTSTLNIREQARQQEALKRGRSVQIGGRGQAEPVRVQRRTLTGVRRAIRSQPYGQGALPTATQSRSFLDSILRRVQLRRAVREDRG